MALAGLEFCLYPRLALNLWKCSCLCPASAEITGMPPCLLCFIFQSLAFCFGLMEVQSQAFLPSDD